MDSTTGTDKTTAYPKRAPLILQKIALGAQFHFPTTRQWALGSFFFLNVPQMAEKSKNEGDHFEIIDAFLNFSSGKKQNPKNPCFKQHAFLVDPSGVFFLKKIVVSNFHVFLPLAG